MSALLAALWCHARRRPFAVAVQDEERSLSYGSLYVEVERLSHRLLQAGPRAVAIFADNGIPWLLADLAAHCAGIATVPLPLFFSPQQLRHTLQRAGVDLVLTDRPAQLASLLGCDAAESEFFCLGLQALPVSSVESSPSPLPAGTQKITFTSGTTGEPKGVCLSRDDLETVAISLREACDARPGDRHLCLLPLATLLENVGGIYVPLLTGATVCLPRLASVGLAGSSGLDVQRMIEALVEWKASSAIMVPQMLEALIGMAGLCVPLAQRLRYLAVGGAPVSPRLLQDAAALGLPVHEGYGLSECGSVVALNRAGDGRPGSVGKPLPHVRIEFAGDGEILVYGRRWLGYLGGGAFGREEPIATGDLGYLDEDGYLYLTGRKKNVFITSFGRNVAPEWVERELTSSPAILQAAVFGEARPFNVALLVPHPAASREALAAALTEANQRLPDYARVGAWLPAAMPFTTANGMATANGRLRRDAILCAYADRLETFYQSPQHYGAACA